MDEKYPECEKLAKVSKESNAIGEFFDWLREEKNIVLFQWHGNGDNGKLEFVDEELPEGYYRVYTPFEKLLAQYFEIDLNKVEKERQQMLEKLRNYHKK